MSTRKGTIAILTGGGDVPGLNPAIRALTVRALREGYRVLGIRRGWAGLVELVRDKLQPSHEQIIELSEEAVNKVGRTGCVPRSVEKERHPPLRHQSIISGGNLRAFENLAQTLVAVDAS